MERADAAEPGLHAGLPNAMPVEVWHQEGAEALQAFGGEASVSAPAPASSPSTAEAGGAGNNIGGGSNEHGRAEPQSGAGPSSGGVGEIPDPFPELAVGPVGGASVEEDGEQRGQKRDHYESLTFLADVTMSLMAKSRLEVVWYPEVWEDFEKGDMHLLEKYNFEQVKTYWMNPDEDWEVILNRYGKVALRPDCRYYVREKVVLRRNVYLLGNGATIEMTDPRRGGFVANMQEMCPGVVGLSGVTFHGIRFCGNNFGGVVIVANTPVVVHNCYFFGFSNTCIELRVGGKVRGSSFYACWKGVVAQGKSKVSVHKCMLERCTLGISSEGFLHASDNVASDNGCFILLKGGGRICHNMICGPGTVPPKPYQMVTCTDGKVRMLKPVHIVGHRRRPWPEFEHNVMTRCSIYLGGRRGVFMPRQCNLAHCNVIMEPPAATQVCFSGIFDISMVVYKILRYDDCRARTRTCDCGASHLCNLTVMGMVTEEVRLDHCQHSCLREEFSSSDEED
ncbi:E1b 55K [Simian adenovirus 20]|uniref:E1B 55 kDa protein n=1 Tax=Simian adenovirus 20 TaxID=585059 RepID=F6KST7_9ADEN|nr:E1b 55K [Simian adenovirus 20]AEF59042.1 E1b 55K [Simian adenovirus 20]